MDGASTPQFCLPRHHAPDCGLSHARDALAKLAEARTLAERVADAADATDVKPTIAQQEAGNYRKGKVAVHGLMVSIENPRGSHREGTDKSGSKWRTRMAHHYGFIGGTKGKDGDAVDVFLGPEPECELAFVINQNDPATGRFDEHKVMLGFKTEADAKAGYLACYASDWKGFGSTKAMTLDQFKEFLAGDMQKRAAMLESQNQFLEVDHGSGDQGPLGGLHSEPPTVGAAELPGLAASPDRAGRDDALGDGSAPGSSASDPAGLGTAGLVAAGPVHISPPPLAAP